LMKISQNPAIFPSRRDGVNNLGDQDNQKLWGAPERAQRIPYGRQRVGATCDLLSTLSMG
jgi:hypothetical protein